MSHLSQIAAVYLLAAADGTPLSSYGDGDGGGDSLQRNSAGGSM